MEPGSQLAIWLRRARWRLRGAWQAPAFVVFTIAGTLILELLPLAGDGGPGLIGAFLIAGFINLFGLAVLGPLIGLWLNRRSGDRPLFAARDRGGVYALAGLCALLVAAGLAHRPALKQGQRALTAQITAARAYFAREAPAGYRAQLPELTTWKPGEDLYRTCLAGPDPRRHLCVYVMTDESPPRVTRDDSQEPNERLAGPGAAVLLVR